MKPLKKRFVLLFRTLGLFMILGGIICLILTVTVLADGSLTPPDDLASGYFGRLFNRPAFLMPFYVGLLASVIQCATGYIAIRAAKDPMQAAQTIVLTVFSAMFWLAYCLAFFGASVFGSSAAMRFYPFTVAAGFILSSVFLPVAFQYKKYLPSNRRDVNPMIW